MASPPVSRRVRGEVCTIRCESQFITQRTGFEDAGRRVGYEAYQEPTRIPLGTKAKARDEAESETRKPDRGYSRERILLIVLDI